MFAHLIRLRKTVSLLTNAHTIHSLHDYPVCQAMSKVECRLPARKRVCSECSGREQLVKRMKLQVRSLASCHHAACALAAGSTPRPELRLDEECFLAFYSLAGMFFSSILRCASPKMAEITGRLL